MPGNYSNKARRLMRQEDRDKRTRQMEDALQWCRAESKGAKAAVNRLKPNGKKYWPLVKRDALRQRLSGAVLNGKEYSTMTVLTPVEEAFFRAFLVSSGLLSQGSRAMPKNAGMYVIEMLKYRERLLEEIGAREANGGVSHAREPKAVMKLSRAAKAVLAKGVPGREFWDSFMTRYPSLELHKSVSLDNYRVTWCKPDILEQSFKELASLLRNVGIMSPNGLVPFDKAHLILETGEIFNALGTQPTNMSTDNPNGAGSSIASIPDPRAPTSRLAFSVQNERAILRRKANSDDIFLSFTVDWRGEVYRPCVIFGSKNHKDHVLPYNWEMSFMNDYPICTCEGDGSISPISQREQLQALAMQIQQKRMDMRGTGGRAGGAAIEEDDIIVMKTDSALGKFDPGLLDWCARRPALMANTGACVEGNRNSCVCRALTVFLDPPNTGAVLRPLDQVYQYWHMAMDEEKRAFFDAHPTEALTETALMTLINKAVARFQAHLQSPAPIIAEAPPSARNGDRPAGAAASSGVVGLTVWQQALRNVGVVYSRDENGFRLDYRAVAPERFKGLRAVIQRLADKTRRELKKTASPSVTQLPTAPMHPQEHPPGLDLTHTPL